MVDGDETIEMAVEIGTIGNSRAPLHHAKPLAPSSTVFHFPSAFNSSAVLALIYSRLPPLAKINSGRDNPRPSPHLLLALGDAWCCSEASSGAGRAQEPLNDTALHAPESSVVEYVDQVVGPAEKCPHAWRHFGDGGGREN